MNLIKTVLLVLVVIAATVAGTMYYLNNSSSTVLAGRTAKTATAAPAPVAIPNPIFLPLEAFTVTLNDKHSSRILYLEITLRVADTSSRGQLVEYMPEVRNRILAELARHTPDSVQTPEGRANLIESLRSVIAQRYHPELRGPDLQSVLFTAFVVQ